MSDTQHANKLRTELDEWIYYARLAFKGDPFETDQEKIDATEKRGIAGLEELMRGCGDCDTPEPIVARLLREMEEMRKEIAALKEVEK